MFEVRDRRMIETRLVMELLFERLQPGGWVE